MRAALRRKRQFAQNASVCERRLVEATITLDDRSHEFVHTVPEYELCLFALVAADQLDQASISEHFAVGPHWTCDHWGRDTTGVVIQVVTAFHCRSPLNRASRRVSHFKRAKKSRENETSRQRILKPAGSMSIKHRWRTTSRDYLQ